MADDEAYEAAKQRVEARIGFFVHAAVYVVINFIFLIVVGWDFLWATVFWGVGLAFHGFATFFKDDPRLTAWKERAIEKEMKRGSEPPTVETPPTSESPPSEPPPTSGTVGQG
jgi:2TM domain